MRKFSWRAAIASSVLVLIIPSLTWMVYRNPASLPAAAVQRDLSGSLARAEKNSQTSVPPGYARTEDGRRGPRVESQQVGEDRGVEVVLCTTWLARDDKRIVHDNVLRTWTRPALIPVLFSHEAEERKRAEKFGWVAAPLPRTACGEVPILREMFLKLLADFPAAPFVGFANGDLLLGAGLLDTILGVRNHPTMLERPVLLVLRRYEMNFVNRSGVIRDFRQIEELRPFAKEMTDGSSDAFFTNRLFPWKLIPDIVPGRVGVAMWLVAASLALDVTVIDVSPTVLAVHMTTEAGNFESHFHSNANCNHNLFRHLGLVPTDWSCGHIYRAQYLTKTSPNKTKIEIEAKADRLVTNRGTSYCGFDLQTLKRLERQPHVAET